MTLDDFFMTAAAVLFANLLAVSFVFGMISVTKAERDNREPRLPAFVAILVPIAVFLGTLLVFVPKPF